MARAERNAAQTRTAELEREVERLKDEVDANGLSWKEIAEAESMQRAQACAELGTAKAELERLKGEFATHRCRTCGAGWRLNPADPKHYPPPHPFAGETFTLFATTSCPACEGNTVAACEVLPGWYAEVERLKAEMASVSAELDLPPTIRPAEGEIRRMLDGWKAALAEVERLRGKLVLADGRDAGEWRAETQRLSAELEQLKQAFALVDLERGQLEYRLTEPIEGISPGPVYTLADVDRIEVARGRPYERLRATVAEVERLRAELQGSDSGMTVALREVVERQRDACAKRAFAENENACAVCRGNVALRVASTPLVTEREVQRHAECIGNEVHQLHAQLAVSIASANKWRRRASSAEGEVERLSCEAAAKELSYWRLETEEERAARLQNFEAAHRANCFAVDSVEHVHAAARAEVQRLSSVHAAACRAADPKPTPPVDVPNLTRPTPPERPRAKHVEQPMPVGNGREVFRTAIAECPSESLREALKAREAIGIERYGTTLRTHNGRDAVRDLLEELADAYVYATQAGMEAGEPPPDHLLRAVRWALVEAWRSLEEHEYCRQPRAHEASPTVVEFVGLTGGAS